MRNIPGWAVGALGVGVVAGAFFLGGRLAASDLSGTAASNASGVVPGLQVECEPGQRAILRQTGTTQPGLAPVASVACVGARAVPVNYLPSATRSTLVSSAAPVRTTSVRRATVSGPRSTKKSVAIIAGSTAAGAVIGGLTKGKKGAVIGGLIGGGAATVWDQITRRKNTGL